MPVNANPDSLPGVTIRDDWIVHPAGRLFSRAWLPDPNAAGANAAPIVLFHDSLGSVALWRDFPARLSVATARRVIAYDRLGFGRSDPRAERPSLDFIAEESSVYFPALRAQLGVQRFVAFGHSVGGGMAVHCAADHPDACEALVTVAAQAFAEERTLEGIRQAQREFQQPGGAERLAKHHGDKARWVLDAWIERWLDPRFAAWTLATVLPRVRCPVLAIHGGQDEYGSPRHAELIGTLCGGPSSVEVLSGVGHLPHREAADAVLPLVAAFLAR